MVNLDKIDWLALLALDNAVRLHGDAIHLYRDRRYPASFLLSVLAQEEIGKAHIAARFVWTSRDYRSRRDGSDYNAKDVEEFLGLLYKHPHKQGAFLGNSHIGMSLLRTEKGRKIYQDVFDGSLEAEKQKSTYVGLRRHRGKIDLKGRVMQPQQITKKKAEKQISTTHDYLMDACVGIIADQYDFDISNIKRVFNRRLYKKLKRAWPMESRATKRWVRNIEKFLRKEGMKPL